MPDLQDQKYLALEQYRDSSHLDARIQLHQRFSTNPYGWFRWVFDQLIIPSNSHILEIACGPGTLWKENFPRIPDSWQIKLSDISPGMVEVVKGIASCKPGTIKLLASDAMAIPFPNDTFQAVIANHMLYHLPDRQKALAEINRVLKPGGKFFASTIGENHLLELSQIMEGFDPTKGKYYSPILSPEGFSLENGTGQLAPWFEQIDVHLYPDSLVITEAQPLIAYILSMITWKDTFSNESEAVTDLISRINSQLAQHGSIYIRKCSGIFICNKRG